MSFPMARGHMTDFCTFHIGCSPSILHFINHLILNTYKLVGVSIGRSWLEVYKSQYQRIQRLQNLNYRSLTLNIINKDKIMKKMC